MPSPTRHHATAVKVKPDVCVEAEKFMRTLCDSDKEGDAVAVALRHYLNNKAGLSFGVDITANPVEWWKY